ncbi:hypothetical protein D9C73_005972 [Collichthys lucidus]|uniref:Uncharacterized protein n=1 Tax=Collichthys lucidus TaxID=240159 RepID=A0A4U5U9J2_COLLU|nr:hypothetical protein D9C73_005972 [Collichthys lucidus]
MSASVPEHQELLDRHEYILGRRAELLEQMQSHREQMKIQRKQQVEESEAARHRNSTLLQTRYWASVEESIPAWEHFLLGKGPHPADCPGQPPRRAKQKPSTAKNQGSYFKCRYIRSKWPVAERVGNVIRCCGNVVCVAAVAQTVPPPPSCEEEKS